jgi:hypothetical protein
MLERKISNKFWIGRGVGKVGSWRGRSEEAELEGENKTGGGWRGWRGEGLLYRTLHLLGLSLATICVCTRRYGGLHK